MTEQYPAPNPENRVPNHEAYIQGLPTDPKTVEYIAGWDDVSEDLRNYELDKEKWHDLEVAFDSMTKEKTPGEITEILLDDFLSYRDVLGEKAVRAGTHSKHPEHAVAYANELTAMITSGKSKDLVRSARNIRINFNQAASYLPEGQQLSPYANSISWILWDIGKQEALKDQDYRGNFTENWDYSGSAVSSTTHGETGKMQRVIAARHLGWEMHLKAYRGEDMSWLAEALGTIDTESRNLLYKQGDEANGGQLASSEYTDLGIATEIALKYRPNEQADLNLVASSHA